MENNDEINLKLVLLFKIFNNRPYHLAKYLIENSALNQDFVKKILNSDKLKDLLDRNSKSVSNLYFVDISQMNEFYNSFIEDTKQKPNEKDIEYLTKELNEKLNDCIKNEKYEDAARIRDYMIVNGIKRINNNF
jgi:excinuclease UvrABC helicase subunit UvrB